MNESHRFGGGITESAIDPLVAVLLLLGIVLILTLPRKLVLVPFLSIAMLVPMGEQVVALGAHLPVLRILILSCCMRVAFSKAGPQSSRFAGGLARIDHVFITWALVQALAFTLLYGKTDAFINQVGFLADTLGGYLSLRWLIRDASEVKTAAVVLVVVSLIVAVGMSFEHTARVNVFGALGGRRVPDIREGKVRAQGPFRVSILAGVFGGTVLPLFVWLYTTERAKLLAVVGIFSSVLIVIFSASSTPIMAFVAGVFGLLLWPIRRNMRAVRWSLIALVAFLAVVMKAPVWFLIARADVIGGSSGYHRATLIDQAVRHLGDWWVLGANNNQNWGWDMWDVQNQFLANGLAGGMAALILFIFVVSSSFGALGTLRKSVEGCVAEEWRVWALGAVLLAHIVAFFGIDYFDQTKVWWFLTLAMISAMKVSMGAVTGDNRSSGVPSLSGGCNSEYFDMSRPNA